MIISISRIVDLERAEDFYIRFLGFTYDWDYQFEKGLPVYCQVSLNDIILHLSEHHGDESPFATIRIPEKILPNIIVRLQKTIAMQGQVLKSLHEAQMK